MNILGWIVFFFFEIGLLAALINSDITAKESLMFLLIQLPLLCEGYFMRNRTFGPGFMAIATFLANRKAWPIYTLIPCIPFMVHIFWINLMLVLLAYGLQKEKRQD